MSRDGKKHIESLRDGREVYINGAVVDDHVDHPAFRNSIQSAAAMYDYQMKAENVERMTFASPKTGERVSRMWQLPTSYAELVERRHALESWANLSGGFFGRSPDHVGSALAGMYMGMDLYKRSGDKFANALSDYYEYARDSDLYLTYVIINPQADRSKSASEQANEFLVAGVVDEDHEGITIKGAKMLGTGCPMSNEVMVACIQPLKAGDEKYSFTAMIPLNAKGVKLMSRKSYEEAARSKFDNPLSSSFDENDSVLYFDEVKVPWERVFVHNDIKMAQDQWHAIPTHVFQNYQCQIRLVAKMRFLLGLARKITETNGVIGFPPVKETLGQMAAEVSMVEGMVESMEISGSMYGKYFVPNAKRLYSATVLTQQLYPKFLHSLRELAGGGMIMLPSCVEDFANPEIASHIDKTQQSPVTDSLGRVKLFKLAWDAVGSEFGSRHLQYEMFYSGANMVTRGHAFRTYDWDKAVGMVDTMMSSYGLPEDAAAVFKAVRGA
ncbi:4-hydroxyphenylacetate 3-hydroxylase family protein [Lacisediminimonas profundi]|uniref:4-hydroxyphenylacetate 3-hydroxylase family protein n=1 Tax=Lacisediminimonas profundi TaxID=2603856 RepID=UPI00124BC2EE|nr:4-hydroxyphenylacetate 3-hydroxylase N-terminal domain-containing protein [Lacisediminimonas profundi]